MLPNALFGTVHMYGIMIAIGVLACFGVLHKYGRKCHVPEKMLDFIFYTGIAAIAIGFGTAALSQALYNWIEYPEYGFRITGGITFLGGLAGGAATFVIAYFLFRKKLPCRLWDTLSLISCCILVAHAFGRVGCFFAGCCYGKHTGTWLDVKFPEIAQPVLPTQLYEAAFLFILFGVFSWLYLKKRNNRLFGWYMIAYGVFRFAIEFLRGDDRGTFIGSLSPSQFWSILLVLGGIAVVLLMKKYPPRDFAAEIAETAAAVDEELSGAADTVISETEEDTSEPSEDVQGKNSTDEAGRNSEIND